MQIYDNQKKLVSKKKKDPTGIFASRVRPKMIELLDWFKLKDKIIKMLRRD